MIDLINLCNVALRYNVDKVDGGIIIIRVYCAQSNLDVLNRHHIRLFCAQNNLDVLNRHHIRLFCAQNNLDV